MGAVFTGSDFINVARAFMHAGPLEYGPATIILQVQDNGRGGVVDMPDGRAAGHFGLTGMRERAAAVGGTLEVTSAAGEGTTIRLEAPAPEAVKELR